MKRVVLLLVGLVAMVSMAEAQNVYIAPSKSAIAYHKSKNCSYLKNSVNVTSITTTKAKEMGRHACVRCYPELKDRCVCRALFSFLVQDLCRSSCTFRRN